MLKAVRNAENRRGLAAADVFGKFLHRVIEIIKL